MAEPSHPVVELAHQLAARSGSSRVHEVVANRPGAVPSASRHGSVTHRLVPVSMLRRAGWLHLQLVDGVAVVDLDAVLDDVDDPAAAARLVAPCWRQATFTLVTSKRLDPSELATTLDAPADAVAFTGRHHHGAGAGDALAVLEAPTHPHSRRRRPPGDFTVTAFVTVYNEDDVLDDVLDDLSAQGVQACVMDNWSTDDSWDVVQDRLGHGVAHAERWPADGPPEHFDLEANLARIEELTGQLGSDWFIKHDADERRRAPWPDVTLAEGLWMAQATGYNVVDFTVIEYPPVDDDWDRDRDLLEHFTRFEFGRKPGHFNQLKAWHDFGQPITYAHAGGHRIRFDGTRVHPYKFELHHYPIRSQRHGVRKVVDERQPRYLPAAKERGWHTQYDHMTEDTDFLRDPETLWPADRATFDDLLVERLCGAGLPRDG